MLKKDTYLNWYILDCEKFIGMLFYHAGKVGVPKQLVIKKDPASIPDAVTKAGLRLPLGMSMLHFFIKMAK